ncbi:MAG: hypothetical protein NWE87_01275, partial [Candidatus Bathyarchaeota archaeon]|nr:hypothetical protein [Candidatus Bathyarchaeota archaeon]
MTKNKTDGDENGCARYTIPRNTNTNLSSAQPSTPNTSIRKAATHISVSTKTSEQKSITALTRLKKTSSY